MKLSRLAIGSYLLLVFASGALVGAFGHRLYTVSSVNAAPRNPAEFRRLTLKEYQSRLKLTPDQVQKLNSVLDDMRSKYHEAHEQTKQAIKVEQHQRITEILDSTQRAEYEKMRQEREQREKERKPGPPTGI
jgi:flagellar hook-basal body complex protein FliE